jgi:hypothetical protein
MAMCLTANYKNGISSYELHRCLRQEFAKVNAQDTSAEPKPDLSLEIAHLLSIDVAGYSKLLVNEQIELLQQLNRIVRSTACFRAAESKGKLTRGANR